MILCNLWLSLHRELCIGMGLLGEGAERALGPLCYTLSVPISLHATDISCFSLHQAIASS